MKLHHILALALIPLAASSTTGAATLYQIPQPFVTNDPGALQQEKEINASAYADQWVAAFGVLKVTSSNKIEIVITKDGEPMTLSNIFKLVESPAISHIETGNLLIATQRIGKRDFRVIIDPRQIRYIRETQP